MPVSARTASGDESPLLTAGVAVGVVGGPGATAETVTVSGDDVEGLKALVPENVAVTSCAPGFP
jgi:hypothetical protein